jgi:hypothetical protein
LLQIASFLKNKDTADVIAFYYDTKKDINFKALLREQQLQQRRGAGKFKSWSLTAFAAQAAGFVQDNYLLSGVD